ncbi:hypothetical protein D9M69_568320 [compost metagenome]
MYLLAFPLYARFFFTFCGIRMLIFLQFIDFSHLVFDQRCRNSLGIMRLSCGREIKKELHLIA